ncbi:hypothetical protein MMC07_005196 [Pseudocyphellaria aurata]|nr:hypothetical protein [Pseudocyphellaria aurata]
MAYCSFNEYATDRSTYSVRHVIGQLQPRGVPESTLDSSISTPEGPSTGYFEAGIFDKLEKEEAKDSGFQLEQSEEQVEKEFEGEPEEGVDCEVKKKPERNPSEDPKRRLPVFLFCKTKDVCQWAHAPALRFWKYRAQRHRCCAGVLKNPPSRPSGAYEEELQTQKSSRRHFKSVRLLAAVCIIIFFGQFSTFLQRPPGPFAHRPQLTAQDLRPHIKSVFIASVQYNSEVILRAHWIPNLLKFLNELQTANITVYVSIYENHSLDGTKSALSELARTLKNLNISHTIDLDTEARATVIEKSISSQSGWLETRYGKELRRIVHLAGVRNRALSPLQALGKEGMKFDKILFTNDIFYSAEDAIALLHTRNGNYSAACALDFMNPPWNYVSGRASLHPAGMYDDFATRDSNGDVLGSHLYPYFSSRESKKAILAREAIPVQSCWNGIVAFDAQPFQSIPNPLQFRSIPDSLAAYHVEASECCLIHYDNPASATAGVWINPMVRVGYSWPAYAAVTAKEWPTASELRWGPWKSQWLWWIRDPFPSWKASWRVWRWRRKYPEIRDPGFACVQDLAMVITPDGWQLRGAYFE